MIIQTATSPITLRSDTVPLSQASQPKSLEGLKTALVAHARKSRSVLFAGSGVSARVGLPTWGVLLTKLADVCRVYGDADSANLILSKVKNLDYLGAATVYRLCQHIPEGERLNEVRKLIERKIEEQELDKLESLFQLGFSGCATTNYDRVLHQAYARFYKSAALQLELNDSSLRNGAFHKDFFIARLHGKIEQPDTLVLDAISYSNLESNHDYAEFLVSLLTSRPCLFIGFSFADPAISRVLAVYAQRVGPNFPELHTALIPDDQEQSLGKALRRVNINILTYDSAESHADLWRAIRLAADQQKVASPEAAKPKLEMGEKFSTFKRFIAFGYSQLKAKDGAAPLIEISQEGIVLSLIEESGTKGIVDEELARKFAEVLKITSPDAKKICYQTVARLFCDGALNRKNEKLTLSKQNENELARQLRLLATSVSNRMTVICGIQSEQVNITSIEEVIERIFLVRAWDLAAFYAGASIGYPPDLDSAISEVTDSVGAKLKLGSPAAVKVAVAELLERPTKDEAKSLAEIGRAAFSLQVMFSSPHSTSFQKYSLPQKLYLDSNVLLPLLVEGHPFNKLYTNVVDRLLRVSRENRINTKVCVGGHFINEVVSHRLAAVKFYKELGLKNKEALEKYITFQGLHHGNVFVAAFAVYSKRGGKRDFINFLKEAAPYENERQLKLFLQGKKYTVESHEKLALPNFARFKTLLVSGYKKGYWGFEEDKQPILVEHEAIQLSIMSLDLEKKIRSVFVTADLRLTNVIYSDSFLRGLSGTILSNWGFVGVMDLLVGTKIDSASFSRLVWSSPRTSEHQRIRDYFIQRALQSYDAAIIAKMPDIIDDFVAEADDNRKQMRLNLNDGDDIVKTTRINEFLDRYEEKFFELMKEQIEKEHRSRKVETSNA